jgi:hypothetical protein
VAEPRDTLKLVAVPRLMFLALAIWGAWYAARRNNRPALGTVVVDGSGFAIDACKKVPVAGGESIGADLGAGKHKILRVIRDDHGVQLSLYPKGAGVAIPVDQRACSQWKADFFSEGADPFTPVGGDINFTCAVGGGKIDGTVFFEHCGP